MLVRSFAGKPDQVALARHEVREYLDGMPGTDDVLAIVSALASNAVRHSRSRTGRFVVCVQVYQSYIFVEVIDEAGPWSAPDLDQEPDDHPRGLEIVTRLSRDWGVDPVQDGHRAVWARVPVKAARPSDSHRREEAGSPPVPLPRVSLFSPATYLLED